MAVDTTNDKSNSQPDNTDRPYSPSWIDRINDWVEGLPGSSWMYYLGIWFLLLMIMSIVAWIEGALRTGTFLPAHAFVAAAIGIILTLFYYLDEWAGTALEKLRQALDVDEEEYQILHFKITTLPSGLTLLVSLITIIIIILSEFTFGAYQHDNLTSYPISATILRVFYFIGWGFFGAYAYHTIHQLRLINKIYTQNTRINLFRMKPLYSFSSLSAFTAGSLAFLTYGWMLVNPDISITDPSSVIASIIIMLLALIAFLLPQLGIHRLQVDEKDRLLDEAGQRLEATVLKLNACLDEGKYEELNSLNTALSSLEREIGMLKKISTWPWQPETVRWLATALLLPLGLWLLQYVLTRLLSP